MIFQSYPDLHKTIRLVMISGGYWMSSKTTFFIFIQNVFIGMVPTHLESGAFQCCFLLKEHPSVSLAFPPVG